MQELRVCKFGGTSVDNAEQIRKVARIIKSDPSRKIIVVSAPAGITDMLLRAYRSRDDFFTFGYVFDGIKERFERITRELSLDSNLKSYVSNFLEALKNQIITTPANTITEDYFVSRGEYLNAIIIADYLGYKFVDAQDIIFFDVKSDKQNPKLDWGLTRKMMDSVLLTNVRNGVVVPGFYGSLPDYGVKTFPRGGSDVTGAILSNFLNADIYENWTDVPGLHTADPRIIPKAKHVREITYKEMRELAYTGARVLHSNAIPYVEKANIPVNIRNTNSPKDPGTMVVKDKKPNGSVITGIAGRTNFVIFTLNKVGLHEEEGAFRRFAEVFESYNVSIEHIPGIIDAITAVISEESLPSHDFWLNDISEQIQKVFEVTDDNITIEREIALIAVVGIGMGNTPGIAGKIFSAVGNAGVNIRVINQGASEINVIFGVSNNDYEKVIKAVYNEFFTHKKEEGWMVVLLQDGEDVIVKFNSEPEAQQYKTDLTAQGRKPYLCKITELP